MNQENESIYAQHINTEMPALHIFFCSKVNNYQDSKYSKTNHLYKQKSSEEPACSNIFHNCK